MKYTMEKMKDWNIEKDVFLCVFEIRNRILQNVQIT